MAGNPLKVLVVDDTVIFRTLVSELLESVSEVQVVGTAATGRIALEKIDFLEPDLITLDIEMPDIDGMEVLRRLNRQNSPVQVLLLSAYTTHSADITVEALKLGAADFVLKPASCDYARNLAELRDLLVPKLLALRPAVARGRPERRSTSRPSTVVVPGRSTRPDAIGIGVSTGGPRALHTILSNVPADLPPILIVQHMPQMFTHSLAAQLDRECAPRVVEARDGEEPQAGHVYLAPGGTQMKVVATGGEVRLRITDDPPEKGCKPAVDYLFRSLADVYGGRALAVVMTGMGDDGTLGCEAMKRTGCRVLAQDEDTSVVFGMPRSLIEAGLADGVLPLDRIAAAIIRIARTGDL